MGDDEAPADGKPVALEEAAVDLQAFGTHACAISSDGRVRCWGRSALLERLTNPVPGFPLHAVLEPIEVRFGGKVQELALGDAHVCARIAGGVVRCLGFDSEGQLGRGAPAEEVNGRAPFLPVGEVALGGPARHVWAGGDGTCAELEDRSLVCWGTPWARAGRPVKDRLKAQATPTAVDVGGPVKRVVLGGQHNCGLLESGEIRCWGDGADGALGYGSVEDVGSKEPPGAMPPLDIGGEAVALAAGLGHTCALLRSGKLRCWGLAEAGRLGYANGLNIGDDEAPARAGDVPVGDTALSIATGEFHSCALLATGGVRCWGLGEEGELGYGSTDSIGERTAPVDWGDVPLFQKRLVEPPGAPTQALPSGTELVDIDWDDLDVAPAAVACPKPCRGCRLLFDSNARGKSSGTLSEAEESRVRAAYASYLVSETCQSDSVHLDVRGVGSRQDVGSVSHVISGSFSAPGRRQKLVLLFVGHCGTFGSHAEHYGQRLMLLLEDAKVIGAWFDSSSSELRAIDLDADGRDEVLISGGWAGGGGSYSWLHLVSLADGKRHTLADFDEVDGDTCAFPPGERSQSKIWYRATPGQQCFTRETRTLPCPPPGRVRVTAP